MNYRCKGRPNARGRPGLAVLDQAAARVVRERRAVRARGNTAIGIKRVSKSGARGDSVVGVYYLHGDHLDRPRLLTNSSAQIVWRARYETFGKAVVDADPDGNSVPITVNARLPGQYFDSESGLHYNYLRDYDPSTGRYIQADPIGQLGGINLYAYVAGNPLTYVDPLGLTIFGDIGRDGVPSFSDIPPSSGPCLRAVMGRGGYIKRWIPCDGNPDKPYCPFSDDWDDASPDSGDKPPESWEDVLKEIAWDAATDPWNYIPFKGMMSVLGIVYKSRGLWKITKAGTERVLKHDRFGNFYKSKSDGLWWSKDQAKHGGSQWKVFEESGDGLRWRADADKYGDFIWGKHKSQTGEFIPWTELAGGGG